MSSFVRVKWKTLVTLLTFANILEKKKRNPVQSSNSRPKKKKKVQLPTPKVGEVPGPPDAGPVGNCTTPRGDRNYVIYSYIP